MPLSLWGAEAMFQVKWITYRGGQLVDIVEVEDCELRRLDEVVATCQIRLGRMRQRHATNPPDGFLVIDSDGKELRRWIGKA
jgi:hypothetical protein